MGFGRGQWAIFGPLKRRLSYLAAIATDFFYAKRFSTLQERTGARPARGKHGFIAVQIDSLSYDHLLLALEKGHMPYLRKLLQAGELVLHSYNCGLPSTTPAAQAGIMYGYNDDLPSFRWFDRSTGRVVVCKYPSTLREIRDRLAPHGRGILEGGSSYVNLFDAGADRAIFTVSSFGQSSFLHSIRGLGFLALFLISPVRPLRLLLSAIWEYLTHAVDRIKVIVLRRPRVGFEGLFPLVRLATAVVFREMQTFGVIVDIYRGVPRIYTTYNGYDEVAHHFGPSSSAALRVLKGIDRQIAQIDRLRRHSPYVDYDLYILSDHGQTPSLPFRHISGTDLATMVQRLVNDRQSVVLDTGEEDHSYQRMSFLLEELRYAEGRAGRRKRRMLARMRSAMERRWSPDIPQGPGISSAIVVSVSSSLAHIYFPSIRKLTMSEIEAAYPGLIDALVALKGIGLVVGCEGGHVVVASRRGRKVLGSTHRTFGEDPLEAFGDTETLQGELIRLANFSNSGDLILFGDYAEGTAVAFEEHFGAHGAWGGPQNRAFVACPPYVHLPSEQIRNARELYPIFALYLGAEAHPPRAPALQMAKAVGNH